MRINPTRRRSLIGSAFLAGLVLLAATRLGGCKGEDRGGKDEEVRLGYFANLTHAQAVLGTASGDFASAVAPAQFSSRVFGAGPALIEALYAGAIDIAYVGPGPALNGYARSKGEMVRVVAGAAANGVLIVARPGSGITRLSDLPGKTLATPQYANTQDVAARRYLRSVLGQADLSGVRPIPAAEQAGLMSRGRIDAAWAAEPWGSLLVSQAGATPVAEERALWPEGAFATTVVITTPEFLRKRPEVVERVLGVHVAWTERLAADPDRQLPRLEEALLKLTNKKLPPGVLAAAVKNVTFTDDPLAHTFRAFARWSYDLGLAKDVTDVSGLFDPEPLKRVKASRDAPTTRPATVATVPGVPGVPGVPATAPVVR